MLQLHRSRALNLTGNYSLNVVLLSLSDEVSFYNAVRPQFDVSTAGELARPRLQPQLPLGAALLERNHVCHRLPHRLPKPRRTIALRAA